MKHLFLIIIIVFGAQFYNFAAAKNVWQQKRERYEQAKKEAQQRGEVWDPNKFEQLEKERRERNSISPVVVILILGGILLFAYLITSALSGVQSILNSPERKFWVVILIAVAAFMVLLAIIGRGNKSSGNYYDSSEEYLENSRMHTDRHY